MQGFELVFLAIIQGLTEFLPISSSAHLILPAKILGWSDQGLSYDVAVHLGTLIAVMSYYRVRLGQIGRAVLSAPGHVFNLRMASDPPATLAQTDVDHFRLFQQVCLASLPILLVGAIAHDWVAFNLRSLWVIGFTTLVFGLLLWFAHVKGSKTQELSELTLYVASLIGLVQVLALIPGVSRSGVTISIALLLGFKPVAAAHFSFLLSIPTILAAALYESCYLIGQWAHFEPVTLLVAALISGVSAYLTIAFFIKLLDRIGMMPFVIYRICLALVIFSLLIY